MLDALKMRLPEQLGARLPDSVQLYGLGLVLAATLGAGFAAAVLAPAQLLPIAGLIVGYVGGAPVAIATILVPVRVEVPVLSSISWCDAAIVGAFLHELQRRRSRKITLPTGLGLLVALAVSSLLFTTDNAATVRSLSLMGEGLMLAYATYGYVTRSHTHTRCFVRLWLWLGLVAAISSIAFFYLANPDVWWNLQPPADLDARLSAELRLGSPFWGPSNYAASIFLLFLPMAWSAVAFNFHRLTGCACALSVLVALYLTTSRGALLALVVACIYYGSRYVTRRLIEVGAPVRRRRQMGAGLLAVGLIALVLAGPTLLRYFFESRQLTVGSVQTDARLSALNEAVALVPSYLPLGAGFGASPGLSPAFQGGTHSYPITVLLELGILGLLLAVMVAYGALRTLHRALRTHLPPGEAEPVIVAAGFASLLLVLANSLVEASLEGVVFFWLFAALMGAAFGARRMLPEGRGE